MDDERSSPLPYSRRLDDTWLKAAALGCLWASAEIVLGNFLHNLGIPMAGTIMGGIGIVLMIAVGSLWPVRGLFWRAGLVCALMKALAPARIVFGPMVAIVVQACLMELSIRVFRRKNFSFVLGAILAMSWSMAQFIIRNLLAYGSGAVDLYLALLRWSEKNLGLPAGEPWLPIVLVFALNLAAGLTSGFLGLYIGRRAAKEPLEMSSLSSAQVMEIRAGQPAREFPYSLGWLLADLVMLVGVLALAQSAAWTIWLSAGLLAIAVWILRYREAARPLLRTKFWLWFILLTGLSGALLSSLKHGWGGLPAGVGIGLAMNFRAAVLVVGLSALGTELRSPRVGRMLSRGRFSRLPEAMEAAVEALPLVMANLPKAEETFRRPVTVFHRMVSQADYWLKRLTLRQARRTNVLLLCGHSGEGKSRALQVLLDGLRADGRKVAGILSPSVVRDGRHIGYDLIDISSGRRTELSRIAGELKAPESPSVGRFMFRPEGLRAGQATLSVQATAGADVIVVDEVGPWELKDQGWAGPLYDLTLETGTPMIWVVRSDIMDQVRAHWALQDPRIVDVSGQSREILLEDMRKWLAGAKTGTG
jgi:nucleoside-triphosphatase THEP1